MLALKLRFKIFILGFLSFGWSGCSHFLFPKSKGSKPSAESISTSADFASQPQKTLNLSSDSFRIRIEYPSEVFGNEGFSVFVQDRITGNLRRVSNLEPEVKWDYLKVPEKLQIPPKGPRFHVKMSRIKNCQEGPFHLFIKGKIDEASGAAIRESLSFSMAGLCAP